MIQKYIQNNFLYSKVGRRPIPYKLKIFPNKFRTNFQIAIAMDDFIDFISRICYCKHPILLDMQVLIKRALYKNSLCYKDFRSISEQSVYGKQKIVSFYQCFYQQTDTSLQCLELRSSASNTMSSSSVVQCTYLRLIRGVA